MVELFVLTTIKGEPKDLLLGNHTKDKGANVKRSKRQNLFGLLEEGKFAEVAALLFSHHKKKLGFWIAIKRELLTTASDSKSCLWLQLC